MTSQRQQQGEGQRGRRRAAAGRKPRKPAHSTGVHDSRPWREENSVSSTKGWSRRRKSAPCGGAGQQPHAVDGLPGQHLRQRAHATRRPPGGRPRRRQAGRAPRAARAAAGRAPAASRSTPFCQRTHMARPSSRPRPGSRGACARARGSRSQTQTTSAAARRTAACDMVGCCDHVPVQEGGAPREQRGQAAPVPARKWRRSTACTSSTRREAEQQAAQRHRVHVERPVAGQVGTRPQQRGPGATASPQQRRTAGHSRPGPTEKIDRRRPVPVGTREVARSSQPVVRVLVGEVEVAVLDQRAQRRRSS